MAINLPEKGAASAELKQKCIDLWTATAQQSGLELKQFNPTASLADRLAWAAAAGLGIAAVYTRYSTKKQGSTEDQVRSTVEFAARNKVYVPPEFLCVDEAAKGRKQERDGFERLKVVLKTGLVTCLLIFKLSRLFRLAYKAVQFINEEVFEEGIRAVAVTQSIDTANEKAWRLQVSLHGTMDEELLTAIGDHVREGLVGLFLKNWTTGALPVGYTPVPVPGGPPTRRNLPRTMPGVAPAVADMIRQHYQWIAGGMEITEGWRRWRAAGGAVDPRSSTGQMSYEAYRRMLSRAAYIGIWEFCRKKNVWKSKKDCIEQKVQPPEEVKTVRCEELRIVSDELFWKVQERLNSMKLGTRARRDKVHHLWDLVIGLFYCARCMDQRDPSQRQRYHMSGAKGAYMRCPNPDCPCPVMVHRQEAVAALCAWASQTMLQDSALIDMVLASFCGLDELDKEGIDREIEAAERKCRSLTRRIAEIEDLMGSGSEEDVRRRKGQIQAAQGERSACELELTRLRQLRGGGRTQPVTREEAVASIRELAKLLDDAAAGRLGPEVVGKATSIFDRLVGGAVIVHAERRQGRKRWLVKGRFVPQLIGAVRGELGAAGAAPGGPPDEQEVWFRQPPRVDLMADEVRQLYEVEGLGFRLINKQLEAKYGCKVGSGNCCAAWRRWYEVRGLPLPERRTKMGRPRRKAG